MNRKISLFFFTCFIGCFSEPMPTYVEISCEDGENLNVDEYCISLDADTILLETSKIDVDCQYYDPKHPPIYSIHFDSFPISQLNWNSCSDCSEKLKLADEIKIDISGNYKLQKLSSIYPSDRPKNLILDSVFVSVDFKCNNDKDTSLIKSFPLKRLN